MYKHYRKAREIYCYLNMYEKYQYTCNGPGKYGPGPDAGLWSAGGTPFCDFSCHTSSL